MAQQTNPDLHSYRERIRELENELREEVSHNGMLSFHLNEANKQVKLLGGEKMSEALKRSEYERGVLTQQLEDVVVANNVWKRSVTHKLRKALDEVELMEKLKAPDRPREDRDEEVARKLDL